MGYSLIWIESLASALLLIAVVTAWSGRRSRRFWQRLAPVLIALVVGTGAGILTYGIGWLRYHGNLDIPWFWYAFAWTLAFVAGSLVLFRNGLRCRGDDGPGARTWSPPALGVALAVLVLLTWTTFANMDLAIKIQLSEVRAEAGAKILAVMPPRVPDRDNAALVYQEAFESLTPATKTPERLRVKDIGFDLVEREFDPKDEELREFLAKQERALVLLRRAAAMPMCSFNHDYFIGANLLLPELDQFRQSAFLLGLDAVCRADQGDGATALEDVAAMFGIARHIDDPILISMLFAVRVEKAATKCLERVLMLYQPKPADLARLALDDKLSFRRQFHRACQMEESGLGLPCFTLLDESSSDSLARLDAPTNSYGLAILQSSFYRVFFLQSDLAGYRRQMKKAQDLAQRPYYEAAKDLEAHNRAIRVRALGIIARLIVPRIDGCAAVAAEGDAAHRLARLACDITAYHRKNGKYPDQLADLTPQYLLSIPSDPFDGQALRMKRDGEDVLLYSVGRDFKDDGGIAGDTSRQEGDIVLRLRGW
jgi:hypothetical protein